MVVALLISFGLCMSNFLLLKGYSILSVDLPGHGGSEGPGIKSIEEVAGWIKRSMEKLKIKEISFM